ncbi:MAG: tetratricopeptide repeat protein [Candidatus Obscuribacterales bacterium]
MMALFATVDRPAPRTSLALASRNHDTTDSAAPETAQTLIDQAQEAGSAGGTEAAVKLLEKAIDLSKAATDSSSLRTAYRKLGLLYSTMKDYDRAVKALNQSIDESMKGDSIEAKTDLVAARYVLARTFQASGDANQALEQCQLALDLARSDLSSAPLLIARIKALKTELVLSHIEDKLDKPSEKPESQAEFTMKTPLTGEVSSMAAETVRTAGSPLLASEIPSLDRNAEPPLKAETESNVVLDGTKKARLTLAQKVTEYGSMGLGLTASIGAPWMVNHVLNGGSAQAAGVRKWDILLSVDGHPITGVNIKTVHFMLTGRKGEIRNLEIMRERNKLMIQVPLWNVYEMRDPATEHIEYYWFLLYNDYITGQEYAKLAAPYEKYLN